MPLKKPEHAAIRDAISLMMEAASEIQGTLPSKADASSLSALHLLHQSIDRLMSIDGLVEYTDKRPAGYRGAQPLGK